jgi:hypothetical protein
MSEREAHRAKLEALEAERQAAIKAAAEQNPTPAPEPEESEPEESEAEVEEPEAPVEEKTEETKQEEKEDDSEPPESDEDDDGADAKRLRRLYMENRALKRAQAERDAELEVLRKQREPTSDEAVKMEAARIAKEQEFVTNFNASCDKVAAAGKAQYKDFMPSLDALWGTIGPLHENVPFVEAIIAAGDNDAHKLVRWLGKNPDEAERIHNLSPVKAGVELAKRMAKLNAPPAPKPVTKMEAPVTPLATPGAGVSKPKKKEPTNAAEYAAQRLDREYHERLARHGVKG